MKTLSTFVLSGIALLAACAAYSGCEELPKAQPAKTISVHLITLDPGHFHASLVQKLMYPQVDPVVNVYAPPGDDVQQHLKRIEGFNTRAQNPTHWQERVYTGPDFLQKMIGEQSQNYDKARYTAEDAAQRVVVIAGRNSTKMQYIAASINAGLNVLSDKPMAITPADFVLLRNAFANADRRNVLLYDIMTERYEITTTLQRELSQVPVVFGTLQNGTVDDPAMTEESVHHLYKNVAGVALTRPAWYYDVTQQGEGIVDVTTHLVDLIQWECFPDQTLDWTKDINVFSAKHWATHITPQQFKESTGQDQFPDYLKKVVGPDGSLNVYCNGEINYTIRGVHAKVSVTWDFEAPPGTGDTHSSWMRGTLSDLVIRQGQEQNYKPILYVINKSSQSDDAFEKTLNAAIVKLSATYPGIGVEKDLSENWQIPNWKITIPASYDVGHEAHFAQVTEKYLGFLAAGKMPDWEVPNMIAKYYTTTKAYEMSR